MFWSGSKKAAEEIVVLDGKNTPSSIWSALKQRGLSVHMFVAEKDGKHTHYPPGASDIYKGNDYSRQYRDQEVESISALNRKSPVAAVIAVSDGIYSDPEELENALRKIRTKIPTVKIIVLGNARGMSADAVIKDYNQTEAIVTSIRELVPQLENQPQRQ